MMPDNATSAPPQRGRKKGLSYTKETRLDVRTYYVFGRLKLSQAAERAGVSYASAVSYKRKAQFEGDDWDRARQSYILAGEGLQRVLQVALDEYMVQHSLLLRLLKEEADRIAAIPAPAEGTDMTRLGLLEKCTRLTSQLCSCQTRMLENYAKAQPEVHKLGVAYDLIERLTQFVQKHYPQHAVALLEILEPFGNDVNRHYA